MKKIDSLIRNSLDREIPLDFTLADISIQCSCSRSKVREILSNYEMVGRLEIIDNKILLPKFLKEEEVDALLQEAKDAEVE